MSVQERSDHQQEQHQQQQQSQREQKGAADISKGSSSGNSNSSSTGNSDGDGDDDDMSPDAVATHFRAETPEWYSRGMQWIVAQHLDHPQLTTWSYLYQRPRSWFTRLFWRRGSSVLVPLLRLEYKGPEQVAAPLLEEVQADFDSLERFRQGVADALSATVDLYAQGRWELLKPMVSAGLLASMQSAHAAQEEAAEAFGMKLEDVQLTIVPDDVRLVCAHAILPHQLAEVDEVRAKEQLPPHQQDEPLAWDCAHVYCEGQLTLDVVPSDGSGGRQQVQVPKSGFAILCRGPLQANKQLPADADVPWFFLAWL